MHTVCFHRAVLLLFFLLCFTADNFAAVDNLNPNVLISVVGVENRVVRQTGTSLSGFALRVTDRAGAPIEGINVEFYVDRSFCADPVPVCLARPATLFGRFANGIETQYVPTDANGVATTVEFIPGTTPGIYSIRANVSAAHGLKNREVLKGEPSSIAVLSVTQAFSFFDGFMSGNWHDPARTGQGVQIEFVNQGNQAMLIWFVFGPDGAQNWIYAQGSYDLSKNTMTLPAVISNGSKFPPQFRSADLSSTPWGTITLAFTGCNSGTMSWNSNLPEYGSGSQPLVRLTSIRGTKCPYA